MIGRRYSVNILVQILLLSWAYFVLSQSNRIFFSSFLLPAAYYFDRLLHGQLHVCHQYQIDWFKGTSQKTNHTPSSAHKNNGGQGYIWNLQLEFFFINYYYSRNKLLKERSRETLHLFINLRVSTTTHDNDNSLRYILYILPTIYLY